MSSTCELELVLEEDGVLVGDVPELLVGAARGGSRAADDPIGLTPPVCWGMYCGVGGPSGCVCLSVGAIGFDLYGWFVVRGVWEGGGVCSSEKIVDVA